MKSSVAIIITIALFFAFGFILLKQCTGLVSSIDGERKSKMIRVIDGYYCNEDDFKIWLREDSTDSYKKVIDIRIDSLAWNNHYIIGFGNGSYFLIDADTNAIKYSNNFNELAPFFQMAGSLNNSFPFIPSIKNTIEE